MNPCVLYDREEMEWIGTDLKKGSERKKLPWLPNGTGAFLGRYADELHQPSSLFSQGARILSLRNFLIHRHILS
jgi:hypothetical protein